MNHTLKHKLGRIYKRLGKISYKNDNIYLIYTMGKVGSSSIYGSLKQKIPFADTFHVHFLVDSTLDRILSNAHQKFLPNVTLGKDVLKFIKNNPSKRIKVITLTREPIVRSISDLFQNWQAVFEDINKIETSDLKNHIESLDHKYALNWFDREFNKYLELDIYELPFDKDKGYAIYNLEKVDICCIKLEKLNEVGPKVLKDFLGMDLNLFTANKSADKEGKDKYQYLKENVKIDKSILNQLYNSKYMQHFYSEKEITNFKRKWSQ